MLSLVVWSSIGQGLVHPSQGLKLILLKINMGLIKCGTYVECNCSHRTGDVLGSQNVSGIDILWKRYINKRNIRRRYKRIFGTVSKSRKAETRTIQTFYTNSLMILHLALLLAATWVRIGTRINANFIDAGTLWRTIATWSATYFCNNTCN